MKRLDTYVYGPVTKGRHWGMFIHWGNKLREGFQAEGLNGLSMSEVRQMLRDVAWREVVDSWREEARSHSKLAEVQKLIDMRHSV